MSSGTSLGACSTWSGDYGNAVGTWLNCGLGLTEAFATSAVPNVCILPVTWCQLFILADFLHESHLDVSAMKEVYVNHMLIKCSSCFVLLLGYLDMCRQHSSKRDW